MILETCFKSLSYVPWSLEQQGCGFIAVLIKKTLLTSCVSGKGRTHSEASQRAEKCVCVPRSVGELGFL